MMNDEMLMGIKRRERGSQENSERVSSKTKKESNNDNGEESKEKLYSE